VRSVIGYMKLDRSSLVEDSFLGLGTTCLESRRLGIPSCGYELNPFAFRIARARVAWNFDEEDMETELSRLGNSVPVQSVPASFARWFPPGDLTPKEILAIGEGAKQIVNRDLRDFLLAATLLCLRRQALAKIGSNPAWIRIAEKLDRRRPKFYNALRAKSHDMFADQLQIRGDIRTPVKIHEGDILAAQPDGKVSAIISSPPYLSRLDYVMAYRIENDFLATLHFAPSPEELRSKLVGGVIKKRESTNLKPREEWGSLSNEILGQVKDHKSKASKDYYYPLMLSYFDGIYRWLERSWASLTKAGAAVIVVQSSYYKDIPIPLPSILVQAANNAAFKRTRVLHRSIVKDHIGKIDPDQRAHASDKVLWEEVLEFRKA